MPKRSIIIHNQTFNLEIKLVKNDFSTAKNIYFPYIIMLVGKYIIFKDCSS